MLNATQVEAFFDTYIQSKVRKGALLISGDWGSGKTHLALTRLKPLAEKSGYKVLYLTIADVQDQEGFERNLLLASYGLKGKNQKIVNIGLGVADRWFTNHGTSIRELAEFRNSFSETHLLLVDDLERATKEVRTKALYRLANLIETTGAKVVIFADEKQIKSDEGYPTIKEKAISKTIEFQPTYEELAKTSTEIVYSSAPKSTSTSKWRIEQMVDQLEFSSICLRVLHQSNCRNLRTAIAGATDACEVIESITSSGTIPTKEQAQALVYSTFVYVVEIRSNKDNQVPLRQYVSSGSELPWMHFLPSGDPSKAYLTDFEMKYVDSSDTRLLRSTAVLNFVEKGACDPNQIWSDLAILSPEYDSLPAYKKIGKYQSISKSEFVALASAAVSELTQVQIRSFHVLAESAQTLFFLSRKNLISLSPAELRVAYSEVLEKLASKYTADSTDISIAFDQTLLWNQPDNELKLVLEHIQEVASKLEVITFTRIKKLAISKLNDDLTTFINSLIGADSQIASRECLTVDDASQIFEILKRKIDDDSVPHQTFYKLERAISYRYLSRGLGRNFKNEVAFLTHLLTSIETLEMPAGDQLLADALTTLKSALQNSIQIFRVKIV